MASLPLSSLSATDLSAAKAGSVLLPSSKSASCFLVVEGGQGEPMAVCLSKNHAFKAFPCSRADGHIGFAVSDITVEADLSSAFDPKNEDRRLGDILFKGADAMIVTDLSGGNGFQNNAPLRIFGEKGAETSVQVGFRSWSVIVWNGSEKVVLHTHKPSVYEDRGLRTV